jgi:hypothetical protein
VRLPLPAPSDVGANVTLQLTVCPALSITGRESPLTEKLAPESVACVSITFVSPAFVRVRVWVWLEPTGTLPKLKLEGFVVSSPTLASAIEERAKTVERSTHTRNPREIPHLEK